MSAATSETLKAVFSQKPPAAGGLSTTDRRKPTVRRSEGRTGGGRTVEAEAVDPGTNARQHQDVSPVPTVPTTTPGAHEPYEPSYEPHDEPTRQDAAGTRPRRRARAEPVRPS
jgi:hypothetical protein